MSQIDDVNQKLDQLAQAVSDLAGRVQANQPDLSGVEQKIDQLNQQVAAIDPAAESAPPA